MVATTAAAATATNTTAAAADTATALNIVATAATAAAADTATNTTAAAAATTTHHAVDAPMVATPTATAATAAAADTVTALTNAATAATAAADATPAVHVATVVTNTAAAAASHRPDTVMAATSHRPDTIMAANTATTTTAAAATATHSGAVGTAPSPLTPARPVTVPPPAKPAKAGREQSTRSWSSLFTTNSTTGDAAKLHYVPPTMEGDKMLITATPEELAEGQDHWRNTLVGYFIGSRPPYSIVKARAEALWKPTGGMELLTLPAGFYIFRFSLAEDRDRILEGGPWFIQNRLLLLKPWDHNTKLQKINLSTVPIWVKIHDLPLSLWTPTLISMIASGIGVPLYMDKATTAISRITYARICIEVSADQQLPSQIRFTVNGNQDCTLRLEYDRRPPRCNHCCVFGHGDANCPTQPPKERAVWKVKQSTQPATPAVPAPAEAQQATPALSTTAPVIHQVPPTTNTQQQPSKAKDIATPMVGTVTAEPTLHSKKQSPKQKGKQLLPQGNSIQTITVNNRFQYLTSDIENEARDQIDQAGPSTGAGCKPPDPPHN